MDEIFQLREDNHYNLLQASQFLVPHVKIVFNGRESVSFLGLNPVSSNPTHWSNTLKQFVGFCRRIV